MALGGLLADQAHLRPLEQEVDDRPRDRLLLFGEEAENPGQAVLQQVLSRPEVMLVDGLEIIDDARERGQRFIVEAAGPLALAHAERLTKFGA